MNTALASEYLDLPEIPGESDPPPAVTVRETVRLADLQAPARDDGRELICDRFLCRGGSVLFVGPTGAGKSSAAMQAGILWSVGKPFFGLRPSTALRVLYVQAENDGGDLHEMRDGIYKGLELSGQDMAAAGENVRIATVCDAIGTEFIEGVLCPLLAKHSPDLLVLDPLLAYLGGDVARQDVVSKFVRSGLQPAIAQTDCGLLLVHHPPKPRKDVGEAKAGEDAYFGAGSADLANWARGVIVLKPTTHNGIYNLRLAKRGRRAGWVEADGRTPCFERNIAHGKGGLIYWRDAEQGEEFKATASDSLTGDLLAFVPITGSILKSAWIEKAKARSVGEKRAERILETLESEHRVYRWKIPRPNARPQIAISRDPQAGTAE